MSMSFLLAAILAFGGAEPSGAVVDGGDALYGVTQVGGPNCISPTADWKRAGCGVVFRVAYDGSRYTVIHAFSGADGKRPIGPLVLGSDSRLYGRTNFGGADDRGVLFSLMRDGSDYRILGAGQTLEAGSPMAADAAGTLFGVSSTANVQRKIISLRDGNVRVLKRATSTRQPTPTHVRTLTRAHRALRRSLPLRFDAVPDIFSAS